MRSIATRAFPALDWIKEVRRDTFGGDLIAGIITAILLVPQAMAYSALAGLPPEIGLYASIAPPLAYALFGSSKTLAVGPVAVASLMVAHTLSSLNFPESSDYITSALILSIMIGIGFLAIALFRLGFLTEFLSHPVLSGFTSAAAILIAVSQLIPILGLEERLTFQLFLNDSIFQYLGQQINIPILAIGSVSILLLYLCRKYLAALLNLSHYLRPYSAGLSKTGPLLVLVLASLIVTLFELNEVASVAVIGVIPEGLPSLHSPDFDLALIQELAPSALLITLISYVESVAIAKVLAVKRRQKIDVNREAWGLGFANLSAGFTGGSPVCGGFSRSVVNFSAGANTQLSAIITALLIGFTLVFLTSWFYFIPKAVLAAIILVAILELVDVKGFLKNFSYDKADGISQALTFITVLSLGIETGLVAGIVVSLLFHFWKSSRPHIAVVGQVGHTEHFRNIRRHRVKTYPHLLALRIDESLFFANATYLETYISNEISDNRDITDVLLICSAINAIDGSALHTLELLQQELSEAGVMLHLAEVKGPVMDRLRDTEFLKSLKNETVFLSTFDAFKHLSVNGNPLLNDPDWSI